MAKERAAAEGVEERDVSDGSVEEITEEDFKHDGGGRGGGGSGRSGRVWGNGYVEFPRYLSRNHMFSSFAWMQAVKNKPLSFGFGDAAAGGQDPQEAGSQEVCVVSDSGDEKEEGELEEGEIDDVCFSEVVVVDEANGGNSEALEGVKGCAEDAAGVGMRVDGDGSADSLTASSTLEAESMEMEEPEDLDQRVGLILEDLETVTEEEVEKSFDWGCWRVLRALERLQKMLLEGRAAFMDAVIQQAFMTMEIIHSVYLKTKDKNKNAHARFMLRLKDNHSALFTAEQMKEIAEMVTSPESEVIPETKVEQLPLNSITIGAVANPSSNGLTIRTELPGLKPNFIKNAKGLGIMLDPHANHDEDSLPSPTRKTESALVTPTVLSIEQSVASHPTSRKFEEPNKALYPYVSDALRAVSSYHKKYDRISFSSIDRLPSPTPSEDGENGGNETHDEVSSTLTAGNINSVPFNSSASVASSRSAYPDYPSGVGPGPFGTAGHLSFESKMGSKISAKSRDPRLRLVNPSVTNALQSDKLNLNVGPDGSNFGPFSMPVADPRKHKAVGGSTNGDHPMKRQRNDFSNSKGSQFMTAKGGWLEGNGSAAMQSIKFTQPENVLGIRHDFANVTEAANVGGNHVPPISSASVTLPSLLKDIVHNPTVLLHLMRVAGNQKLASNAIETVLPGFSESNKTTVQVPSVENMPLKPSPPEQKLDLKTPISGEMMSSLNPSSDVGKPRMKPRDPRRLLQSSIIQKVERSPSPQITTSGPLPLDPQISNDTLSVRNQGEQAQTSGLTYQSANTPDITSLFTKNLKNIANMLSAPQGSVINAPTLSTSTKMEAGGSKGTNLQVSSSLVGERTSDTSHSSDPWGDVDHLLDGYDEQQKAAIQRERARRIEEQNKMFSARKLSLVLDLDHTLLNSAKFAEVEPIHEEILRKKEEMDRDRPQRHLFRFHHMSMWTKLRPGIWNFLEKASKCYELHLYTMGNHLYATEMAKVLDPTGSLFAGRVISKGDENDLLDGDERVPKTKDLEGVMGMESAVVIIDDSVKVWPHNRLNLIVVERYTYFPCSRRQFGLLGPSLLEIDHDERPEDGTLASALAVIERLHQNFFSYPILENVDVRNILAAEQRKILAGCRIVFSRIFPVGEANPHLHPLWQTAEQFGAVCTNQIDDQVTHVVANSLGTDKVNWALSTGRFVVHHGWVEASALLYRRANEHDFTVKP